MPSFNPDLKLGLYFSSQTASAAACSQIDQRFDEKSSVAQGNQSSVAI